MLKSAEKEELVLDDWPAQGEAVTGVLAKGQAHYRFVLELLLFE